MTSRRFATRLRGAIRRSVVGMVALSLGASVSAASPSMPAPRDVTYFNGSTELAATFLLPAGDGPFPGVVLVHGSGTSDRSNAWTSAYATAFAKRGIAVLYPDKRGSGKSGGDWMRASFEELAGDAIAGVEWLGGQRAVDDTRVGLVGFSQGGDVVPLAAKRSLAVHFVVSVSASVVPMTEQVADEILRQSRREGLGPMDIARVARIHENSMRFAQTGEGWKDYLDALDEARSAGLGDTDVVKGFPTDRNDPIWGFVHTISGYDPMQSWKDLRIPALFLYGGQDDRVDVPKSLQRIEAELAPSGLRYSVLYFRHNGHALFREDAMDFLARWIRDGGVD